MTLPQPTGTDHEQRIRQPTGTDHEQRIRQLEERADSASDLLQEIEHAVHALDAKLDRRFDALDAKVDRLEKLVLTQGEVLHRHSEQLDRLVNVTATHGELLADIINILKEARK